MQSSLNDYLFAFEFYVKQNIDTNRQIVELLTYVMQSLQPNEDKALYYLQSLLSELVSNHQIRHKKILGLIREPRAQ